jgi:hypothetical protein
MTKLPSWLDPNTQVKTPSKPQWFDTLTRPYSDAVFYLWNIIAFFEAAEKLGGRTLSINQAIEIAANSAVETLHGEKWNEFNWGGVKVNKNYVNAYKALHDNVSPRWFSAAGHVNSGDQEVVYYVAFDSIEQYCEYWLTKFVLFSSVDFTGLYSKTAKAFWENYPQKDKHWFYELCVSGYKGAVTQKNPTPSVDTFFNVEARIRIFVTQLLLGVKTDGDFGPKSKQACLLFQQQAGLQTATGEITDEAIAALVMKYRTDGDFMSKFKFRF